jgi:hypothetical protein
MRTLTGLVLANDPLHMITAQEIGSTVLHLEMPDFAAHRHVSSRLVSELWPWRSALRCPWKQQYTTPTILLLSLLRHFPLAYLLRSNHIPTHTTAIARALRWLTWADPYTCMNPAMIKSSVSAWDNWTRSDSQSRCDAAECDLSTYCMLIFRREHGRVAKGLIARHTLS